MDSVHARFVNNSFAVFPGAQGTSQLLSILTQSDIVRIPRGRRALQLWGMG
jgi:hypothetical protein